MPLVLLCPDEATDQQPQPTDAAVDPEPSAEATAAAEALEAPDQPKTEAGLEATEGQPVELEATEKPKPAIEQPTPEPPPPATEKPKPDPRAEYLRKKSSYEESIAAISIELVKLAESQKHLKKERDVLTENLSELIDDWERGPADQPAVAEAATDEQPEEAAVDADADADAKPQAEQPSQQPSQAAEQVRYEQALRAAPVDQLGLPKKVTERLTEAGATDIWRLEQLRAEISQGREKWPKGIGEAKVTQIEDSIMGWMSRNVSAWQAPETESETEPEPKPEASACSVDDL